jgi:hypothetical protein
MHDKTATKPPEIKDALDQIKTIIRKEGVYLTWEGEKDVGYKITPYLLGGISIERVAIVSLFSLAGIGRHNDQGVQNHKWHRRDVSVEDVAGYIITHEFQGFKPSSAWEGAKIYDLKHRFGSVPFNKDTVAWLGGKSKAFQFAFDLYASKTENDADKSNEARRIRNADFVNMFGIRSWLRHEENTIPDTADRI